jgi:hypothetical protein
MLMDGERYGCSHDDEHPTDRNLEIAFDPAAISRALHGHPDPTALAVAQGVLPRTGPLARIPSVRTAV